ncbi:MAG TPA: hypothetical protein VEG34_07330 [Thermoanaerobaculia bacterium]|nr:hypothetical protein [Thermoanaerobaculia bacterium]
MKNQADEDPSGAPIQVEGGRDDGQLETTPEVEADRETQSEISYDGWDDQTARDQDNLPEDDQQG